jgi:steroid 5-alpha reductase family enzyme
VTLVAIAGALLVYMTAAFGLAVARRDNSIADIAWGGGFVLVALIAAALGVGALPRPILLTALVVVWAARLAIHVLLRNRGRGEDPRYAAWRREWGRFWVVRSYFQVFVLQGAILLVVAAGIIVVNTRSGPGLGALDLLGALVVVAGLACEAVADLQLARFIRDPANHDRVMDRGLWRYSRHPNYFGEAVVWWGIWLIALSVPGGWWAVVSPLAITFLLLKVSGVPMLERLMEGRPGWAEYKARTSVFVPLPPRSVPPA